MNDLMNDVDISLEHDFHNSEDWETLQDKCPKCFEAVKRTKVTCLCDESRALHNPHGENYPLGFMPE